jgi:hypothetical protein
MLPNAEITGRAANHEKTASKRKRSIKENFQNGAL